VKHILVPTDGSGRSRRAIRVAVDLARALRARVTGIYVIAEGVPTAFSGGKLYGSGVMSREYRSLAQFEAARALAELESRAAAAGVRHASVRRQARHPWRAILRAARARGCDLIVMGSHGRGSVRTVLLGSQAAKVLAHSKIPVLVCR
jgi:nucleotide-binding universal stress UspA family protein